MDRAFKDNVVTQQNQCVTYHAIGPAKSTSIYDVSCSRFDDDLRMIADLEKLDGRSPGPIAITFDDGHGSNFELAAPRLEQCGRHGTFFVVGSLIGVRPDFMTWSQLRELSEKGHSVYSHSWSHPLLTHCSDEELDDELVRSRQVIEDKLARNVDALGVPGGRWNKRVLRAAARAGYRSVYISDPFLTQKIVEGVHLFGRVTVKSTLTTAQLRSVLAGSGFQAWHFRTRYRAKEAFRKLVGDKTYNRVWAAMGNSGSEKKETSEGEIVENGLGDQA